MKHCPHNIPETLHCYECEVANIAQTLPDACCAHCLWWNPNQTPGGERYCWFYKRLTDDRVTCDKFTSKNDLKVNVPQHTPSGNTMQEPVIPIEGVEIFIVTYAKDAEWLQYCLRAIKKHLTGFQGVTVAHPNSERETFARIQQAFGCRLYGFDEVPGKGMLHHMVIMASADQILPSATRFVMHLDADCIYTQPTVPSDYFHDGKPVYLWRTYDSLTTEDPHNPGSKVISDCAQWKNPTEHQLGFPVSAYTMCRHPTVFPMGFYPCYRAAVQVAHGDFAQFMLSGRNEFPQDRMDFTAMGAFGFHRMREAFHWINCGEEPYPADRQRCYWSHGGVAAVRAELESFVS